MCFNKFECPVFFGNPSELVDFARFLVFVRNSLAIPVFSGSPFPSYYILSMSGSHFGSVPLEMCSGYEPAVQPIVSRAGTKSTPQPRSAVLRSQRVQAH